MTASKLARMRCEVTKERNRAAFQGVPWLFLALILSYLAWAHELVPFELSVGTLLKGQVLFLVSFLAWCGFALYTGQVTMTK